MGSGHKQRELLPSVWHKTIAADTPIGQGAQEAPGGMIFQGDPVMCNALVAKEDNRTLLRVLFH